MLKDIGKETDLTCDCASWCPASSYPVLAEYHEVPLECPRQMPIEEAVGVLRDTAARSNLQITTRARDLIARRAAGATLEDLVLARQLTLLRREEPSFGHSGSSVDPPPAPDPEPTPPPKETAWIRFRVVDDETEKPLAGVIVRVREAGGAERDYVTQSDGRIEIDPTRPPACDIVCISSEPLLEVVRVE